ncbi:MAG: hydantoinase/oxoprolinase family protein [Rhodobacteraceae bacterium]|nr:hydantoinase/oxoprolinase family protein [Paracoccaceae bacterium]
MWRVGVDVGGTFTDLFAWHEGTGERRTCKVLTTKNDRSEGVLAVIADAGIPLAGMSVLVHGTTTATNALIERSYPEAALVTTEGFRDVLEIGRMHREFLYRPYQTKPSPLIRRRHRFTVDERLSAQGETVRPLDVGAARAVAGRIAATPIRSIAVCFINSYVTSRHERAMCDILQDAMPDADVVCSGDLRPVFREHGRFTTAAIAACLMPVMRDYFDQLERRLADGGFGGRLLILKSNGGMMSARFARHHPEELIESGPAGGVAYAAHLCRSTGFRDILHTDVGGTSFDTSILPGGEPLVTRQYELEWDVPVMVPMLDIRSVGAGGGSVAWVDDGGSLRVGPRSAGSEPGPACYGRGGTEATVTDANLLLGRLHPSLGGKFALDVAAARRAVQTVADAMGMSLLEAAEGIVRIGCETMAHAVKAAISSRGRDPRDFVLASFGGAGPMHACFVAQALSIPRVVVPAYAGVASAFGATAMDIRHDIEAFHYSPVSSADPARIEAILAGLQAEGHARLAADGITPDRMRFIRSAQMRYVGQTYEITVPLPEGGALDAAGLERLGSEFHETHRIEYGVASDDFFPEIVSLGVAAIGVTTRLPDTAAAVVNGDASRGTRPVYFDGHWHDVSVHDGEVMGVGTDLSGPAIIEYAHAIAVMPPGATGRIDRDRNLIVTLA